MRASRTEKSMINMIAVICLKVLQIMLPFISRTLIIHKLGLSYVGLSGLFTSIIGVLSLAELGVGSALVYAMYEPVQEENQEKICQILAFYRKAYFIIGIAILAAGILLTPFLNSMIKSGTYPADVNIYYIYYVHLINTVITYLVYAYKASLLDANQMGYIGSKVKIQMLLIQYISQIILIMGLGNYYAYITVMPICTVITCIVIGRLADRKFPNYKPKGEVEAQERKIIIDNVKALFLYKIGSVISNSVDSIVISWYFGAYVLGIYNNYYYVVSSLFSLLLSVGGAVLPSIGNSIVAESKEKNYNDFMMFSFVYNWVIGWCIICLICLFQPFVSAWVGTDNLLDFICVILFAVYFFAFRIGDIVGWYKDAAGLWKLDRYRPIISSILNLILNILLIQIIGLHGVLLSTIIALIIINYPIAVRILLQYFEKSGKEYLKQQIFCCICIIINVFITYKICVFFSFDNAVTALVFRALVCIVVPNILFLIIYCKNKEFSEFIKFIRRKILKRK